jgi:hypothetical protein
MPANSNDRKNMAKHILPTSANLLGLCFVIFTLKKFGKADGVERIIDKMDGVVIIIFLAASVLSYASMRSAKNSDHYEKIADMVFLVGLFLLSLVALITVYELA